MRSTNIGSVLATLAAAVLIGACGSGNIGDILGGPSGQAPSQIRGIVRSVDTRSGDCRIDLDNATASSYLANSGSYGGSGNGNRASVYCDNQTRVVFQGQTFRPDSLEVGDEVIADVRDVGGRLVADRIDVTYDVSSNDRYGNDPYARDNRYPPQDNRYPPQDNRYPPQDNRYPPQDDRYGGYGTAGDEDVRGTVRRLDRENRTVTLDRVQYYNRSLAGSGSELLTIYYDNDTRVSYRGQAHRPENLEPGDVVAVDVDQVRGTLVADDIQVLSDARDSSAAYPRR